MSFHLAWRNLVFEESHALTLGDDETVITGALANLRTPQLANRVTIRDDVTGGGTARVRIVDVLSVDGRTVQVLAMLDVETVVVGEETGPDGLTFSFVINTLDAEPITVPAFYEGFPRHLIAYLPTPVENVRRVELIVETLLADNGSLSVSIGALWYGPALELPVGPIRLRHLEQARSTTTPGGQRFGEDSVTVRELRFDCEAMTQALAIGTDATTQDVQQAIQFAGETGAVLAIPYADDEHVRHRLGVYGVMTNTGELVRRASGVWQWSGAVVTEQR